MFVGSYFVNTLDEVMEKVTDADMLKTRDNLGNIIFFRFIISIFYLVKGHELTQRRDAEYELGSRLKDLQFGDLKDGPLGSVPSILFWNDQQRQIYTRVTSMKHTLLVGDYGTGLCILLTTTAFIEYLST